MDDIEEDKSIVNHPDTDRAECAAPSRHERRKKAKKERRRKKRRAMAEMARREEEARLNDSEEQRRLQIEEDQERLRAEEGRRLFEERERKILEAWERKKALVEKEEEERRRRAEEELLSKQNQVGHENEEDDDDEWEYVEEGPPEIIWQGNEIIVKKKKIRVKKKDADQQIIKQDLNRPTSNPLPPQSEAFADHKNAPVLSAQQLLDTVAQETPNFGTELDKAHCPFHLKTGACRFGSRCSRIHFYPDKSCTLLIKNMYNGPGLAWEQDEGLEYTDEEVERAYEEFYEDVHTEFLKFGEIINFKVCRNGASHLRGNVYVHYKCLDSAVLSYQSANGRYFAGKQVQCEFVGVTRWRVAICGEFMKSKLTTCSRGTACNFIHCFRNPGGDYEWADWDNPPPRYWVKEMAALFGYPDESGYDKKTEQRSPRLPRYYTVRSQPRNIEISSSSSRNYSEDGIRSSESRWHHRVSDRKHPERHDYEQHGDVSTSREKQHSERASVGHESDRYWSDRERGRQSYSSNLLPSCKKRKLGSRGGRSDETNIYETGADENMHENDPDPYYHHDCGAGSKRDRHRPSSRSLTGSVMGVSISPHDRWSCEGGGDDVLNSDCSDGERRRGYGEADEYGSESPRDCRRSSKYREERREKSERSSKIEFVDERGRWEPHE